MDDGFYEFEVLFENEVDWLYLDQRMVIPKTSCVTIREFICEFLEEFIVDKQSLDSKILYWANVLKLESVINENTLDSPFNSPSGGEEKRIIILQKLQQHELLMVL